MTIIAKSFFELLKIGFGGSYYKLFFDKFIILYITIDCLLGYFLVDLTNNVTTNLTNKNISLFDVMLLICLPLITNTMSLIFYNSLLKKKLFVVDNILNYIKNIFLSAPNEFHDKFSVNEKYHCFTSSIWGFDSLVNIIISMCSSLIKIIAIAISISLTNYDIGLLIIISNTILLYFMPKINIYLKKFEDIKSHKEYYAKSYYDTLVLEENRINPILENIQSSNINNSLSEIVKRYSNIQKNYTIANTIRSLIKNLLLSIILIVVFYREKYNYIMIILLNRTIIFGFSDFYEDFKKTENSNKKNMEQLTSMLEFLEDYYKNNNEIIVLDNGEKVYPSLLNLLNMDYKFFFENKLVKKLSTLKLMFDFSANKLQHKNIVLISGKTGSGKSLFTKVLSGQMDNIKYNLTNDNMEVYSFNDFNKNRIIINQKIAEEYTYNGNINSNLEKLYPNANNFNEVNDFLKNFGINNKFKKEELESEFNDKLSGGERQRVALSSMIWKILQTNPSYIIIDEPEKGIDEETMIEIMNWIIKSYNGLIFLITHNETIKKKYSNKIQSIIKYKFLDEIEIDTELYQEFN